MNIAEFVLQPDLEKLVIEEIQLARELQEQTWIQCGGADTNVWYIALPNNGEIHKVELDGEALTEKFTIALCHATADTFYYDDLAKILYIHTTDSDDPATLDGDDPKYNISAFWWEFFSNRPKQLEPYEDILKEANGSLEFWASATDVEEWTEATGMASVVSREATETYNKRSAYSCKLTCDAGNAQCEISRADIVLRPGRKTRIRLSHLESASGKTIRVMLRDSGSNAYLNSSEEWQAGAVWITIPNAVVWTVSDLDFVAHKDYSLYSLYIREDDLTSASAYIDNVEVWRYRREVDCHVFLPQGAIPPVYQGVGDYHQPDERLSFGVTRINNIDGWFYSRRLEEGYLWHGRDIRLRVGHKDEDYEDLALFFTGVTRKPVWGNVVEIGVKDERVLLKKIPCEYFDEDNYPAIETEWKGKRIPYLLGPVEDIKPPQINTENQEFKISQAVFDRIVDRTWYINDECAVIAGDWTENNFGQGSMSQKTFKGKNCFRFDVGTDAAPVTAWAEINQTLPGGLPDDYEIEVKLYFDYGIGDRGDPRDFLIEAWNGIFRLRVIIDTNTIDVYDGAAWNGTASNQNNSNWYTFRLVVNGAARTVDVYRNGILVVNAADCSDLSAVNDGKVSLALSGDEIAAIRLYTDYIKVYVETVIEAGTTLGIEDIIHVYKTTGAGVKTELTLGADWSKDLDNGELTVSAALAEGDIITCDAQGLKCDFEDSTYTDLPADFLYFLYVALNGISKYRLDMASLFDLKTNRLLVCGKWISEETDSPDFLTEMKKTAIFQTFIRLDGMIVFHRYSSDVASDAIHYHNEDYIEAPIEMESTDQCIKEVAIKSCYKPYGAYYEYEEVASEDATEWNHKEKGRLMRETILQTQFQAQILGANILSMGKNPPSIIHATLPSSALLLNPCDKIYLNHSKKDSEGNEVVIYDEEAVRILSLDKDLNIGHVGITAMKDVADFNWVIT